MVSLQSILDSQNQKSVSWSNLSPKAKRKFFIVLKNVIGKYKREADRIIKQRKNTFSHEKNIHKRKCDR